MSEPSDELAASIDATLHAESRTNERQLAAVRVLALAGLTVVELWYIGTNGTIPTSYRAPTFFYFAFSVVLLAVLQRGTYSRWLGVALTLSDAGYIAFRMGLTFAFHPVESLRESQELATVSLGVALLIASGSFRLSRSALLTASLSGVAIYLACATGIGIDLPQVAVHLSVLAGIAAATSMLTTQVRRAVRSEVARVTLVRFLPPSVLDEVRDDPIGLITRPRSVRATVLVSDIRGFTRWSEGRSPIEVLEALNVVQGRLAGIVRAHHGMVDKFMGDGMLAVFGTPEARDDHAALALAAAMEMRTAVAELRAEGVLDFQIGIGVHTGELVVGVLGSGVRMEFTVLGDTVNTASRLESLTKERGVELLASGATVAEVPDHGLVSGGAATLRGRSEPIELWAP